MLMTSNFRVSRLIGLCLFLATVGLVAQDRIAPDAPRAAPQKTETKQVEKPAEPYRPLALTSVSVRTPGPTLQALVGQNFMRSAGDPLVVEVQLIDHLGDSPRSNAPVIVLNGKNLANTWYMPEQNVLVAFLSDSADLKATNSVEAAWLGVEEETRSLSPLSFTLEDIER